MITRWYHLPIGLCFYLPFQLFYRLFCMVCSLIYFLLCCLRQPISSCFRTRYAKTALPTLITIRFSHYCEKARWALDLLQDAATHESTHEQLEKIQNDSHHYIETPHSLLTHMPFSLWHTSGFSTSTPVYITRDKHVLKDSADIMHYVSDELCKLGKPTLYPSPQVEELENYFNQMLGEHARRYGYWLMFQTDDMVNALRNCWLQDMVGFERWIQQHFFGPIKALVTAGIKIQEQPSLVSKQQIDQVFEKVNQMLDEHSGLYLFNTNYPTAADFIFASLAYPMIFPPQCDELIISYDPNCMSRQLYDQVTIYRQQRAGQLVLRMYEQHRVIDRIQPGAH
jgi:glutathione S-transferase